MDIPLGAEVRGREGRLGRTTCVVINPVAQKITHVVVRTPGLAGIEYLVPIDWIVQSDPHHISLGCTAQELTGCELFEQTNFVRLEHPDALFTPDLGAIDRDAVFLWPYLSVENIEMFPVRQEGIPPGELGIHRGAHVDGPDGRLGKVDEFIVNPDDGTISHLVLSEGPFWGRREVIIPVTAIDHIGGNVVTITLDRAAVDRLPRLPWAHQRSG